MQQWLVYPYQWWLERTTFQEPLPKWKLRLWSTGTHLWPGVFSNYAYFLPHDLNVYLNRPKCLFKVKGKSVPWRWLKVSWSSVFLWHASGPLPCLFFGSIKASAGPDRWNYGRLFLRSKTLVSILSPEGCLYGTYSLCENLKHFETVMKQEVEKMNDMWRVSHVWQIYNFALTFLM
jgi:hypothetical protein